MARDPLDALLRVRRMALDEARRLLAACLDAELEADRSRSRAEAEIARERGVAERLDGGDAAVEAFAAWLPGARARVQGALAQQDRAAAETARARAGVSIARGAHEAAEEARERKRQSAEAARRRQEQLGLDEAASRRAAARDPGPTPNGDDTT